MGEDWELRFLGKKGGIEIDFALIHRGELKKMIEVKTSEDLASKNFNAFSRELGDAEKLLVYELKREKTYPNGVEVRHLANWLCHW